ncbi:MAG TPA: CDP-alcohol phosphatidyltransferase family protein, partial [Acidimicrobiales bacterium]|nr:CDP-alcohol phosphatidyltransferase family protein [Acidimicrobiales bacterium]
MFDGNFRTNVDRVLDPIGAGLCRIGVTANALTVTGIVVSAIGAVVIGQGKLFLGFIFLILTGLPDALDGAVAKAAGTSSVRGAFFDSFSDRVTDIFLFCGIA